jgi:erythromycin esterase
MESGWSEVDALDATLQTGVGDPGERLYALDWYNTGEVLDLMNWIQEYNQTIDAANVHLLGLDMQYVGSLVEELLAYVAAAGPSDLEAVRADLECFTRNVHNPQAEPNAPLYSRAGPEVRERCLTGLLSLHNRLAAGQQAYEAASSPEAFARALRTAVMLQEAEELLAEPVVGGQIALRDRFMAENAAWLLEQAGPGAKMILWAHNGHVSAATSIQDEEEAAMLGVPAGTEYLPLGARLQAMYGDAYRAVGFAFGHGSFNAYGMNTATGAMTGRQVFTIESPVPGSFEATFSLAGLPQFYLDLGRAAADPQVGAWFSAPGRVTNFGAGYITDAPLMNTEEIVLPEAYAFLVYFEATTPSRLR